MSEVFSTNEHFFQQKWENNEILDKAVVRNLTYGPESLSLPSDHGPVSIKECTVPVGENTAVLRIGEMRPKDETIDKDKPGKTLVIIGGGTSPGPGTNVKLGVEFLETLQASQYRSGINRVLFLPNPTGAPREKRYVDHTDLSNSAKLAAAALKQLGVDERSNLVLFGFSAGGGLAVELATLYKQQSLESNQAERDLILIEPVGTTKLDPLKLIWDFTAGNARGVFKRSRSNGASIPRSLLDVWRENKTAWATLDGKPSLSTMLKDSFGSTKRGLAYAKAFGFTDSDMAPVGPDVQLYSSAFLTDKLPSITGRVLVIDNEGSTIVGQPAARLQTGELTFPNARSTKGEVMEGAYSHSFTMTDGTLPTMATIIKWISEEGI